MVDWTIVVPVEQLLAAARHLRDASDALFDSCSDVTATDWPPRAEFEWNPRVRVYDPFDRNRFLAHDQVQTIRMIPAR